MWYDKEQQLFHKGAHLDRDIVDVCAKLRYMAQCIEQETWGLLTLNQLGDIFGNEFWNLVYERPVHVVVSCSCGNLERR